MMVWALSAKDSLQCCVPPAQSHFLPEVHKNQDGLACNGVALLMLLIPLLGCFCFVLCKEILSSQVIAFVFFDCDYLKKQTSIENTERMRIVHDYLLISNGKIVPDPDLAKTSLQHNIMSHVFIQSCLKKYFAYFCGAYLRT
jgi:hypothetical protein